MPQTFTLGKNSPRADVLARVAALLASLAMDRAWIVTVEKFVKQRTNLQNEALWGCAYKALRESTGNDNDDLHEFFCGSYFGEDEVEVFGRIKKVPKRTTTTGYDGKRDVIDTIELSRFYAHIQRVSSENGFEVPNPDPRWFAEAKKLTA